MLTNGQQDNLDPDGNRVVAIGITEKTFQEMLRGKRFEINLGPIGIPKAKLILLAGRKPLRLATDVQQVLDMETKIVLPDSAVLRAE